MAGPGRQGKGFLTGAGEFPTTPWLSGVATMAVADVEKGAALGRVMSLSDMVMGFFEDGGGCPERSSDGGRDDDGNVSGDDGAGGFDCHGSAEERRAFWESQHQLLQATLARSSSLEKRVRRETEAALRPLQSEYCVCSCSRNATMGCRVCLMREVSERLRDAGYNSALCRSKWRSSEDIPKGEHTYIDVVDGGDGKKEAVRVVIELSFRSEFVLARASEEYNALLRRLPEVFVGKAERLGRVIKVVCAAAKKCMKENKMYMAPWRKHKYMKAKWLAPCERVAVPAPPPPLPAAAIFSNRQAKTRASMLTFDLLEKLPSLRCPAVEVV